MAPALQLVLGFLVTVLLTYWFTNIVYNIYLNPLSVFPGPKLAAASHIPQFIARGQGNVKYVRHLHDTYGDVVRIAPHELSFTGPQAWKDIYGHKLGQKQLPKQIVVDSPDLVLKAPHLILAPDEAHSRMRRNLSHAFSSAAVKDQEHLMTVHFDKMVDRMREQALLARDQIIDMEKMYNCVAFDVIGDLAFGRSFGALDRYQYHEYMIGVLNNFKVFTMFQRLSVYPWALKAAGMLLSFIPAISKGRAKHFGFAAQQVEKRMTQETDRKDFMWYILKHNGEDGRGLSRQELYSNAGLLIGAGSETTATALTGATFLLLQNPPVLRKLIMEVRNAFASGSEISIRSSSQLPYLVAVIEEAMRLYPPGPAANVRVTLQSMEIDGYMVPSGTRVAVQQYSAHRSSRNFCNAEEFLPERWLSNTEARFANDKRDACNPFSFGPRNCIGRSLAYAEMYSILARVIYYFDLELGDDSENWMSQRAFIIWEKGPLWVKIKPRTVV